MSDSSIIILLSSKLRRVILPRIAKISCFIDADIVEMSFNSEFWRLVVFTLAIRHAKGLTSTPNAFLPSIQNCLR